MASRVPRPYFPAWLRRAIFTRDDHTCVYCGRSIYTHASLILHVDHIEPVVLGGAYRDLDNLVTACNRCNCSFGGRRKPEHIVANVTALVARRNRAPRAA